MKNQKKIKKNQSKTSFEVISERPLDWDKIFSDQVHTIYEPLISKIKPSLDKVWNDEIEAKHGDTLKKVESSKDKINDLINEIKKERKDKKINAKWAANCFIVFFCFLIVGLFFLGFFIKNRKVIKEFNQFLNERSQQIKDQLDDNFYNLSQIFSNNSIVDWKNKILKAMEINEIKSFNDEEINMFQQNDKFYSFYSISKYDIRNSVFYDVVYSTEEWRPVVTSGTAYKQIKTKDGWITHAVVAYHSEPTPFIDIKQSVNIPTNYLPELSFSPISNKFSLKEYNNRIKKGEFLLENAEFYQHFNFNFNEKIKFMTYFQLKTQENFVEFSKYFNGNTHSMFKFARNLYTTRNYVRDRIEMDYRFYDVTHNWMSLYFDSSQFIEPLSIYNFLLQIMILNLYPIFKSITQAYLNKNIASENFSQYGSYLSTYIDDKKFDETRVLSHYGVLTKAVAGSKLILKTNSVDKDERYVIEGVYHLNDTIVLPVIMSSYWAENLIDSVFKEGVIVNVPYTKYNYFEELKFIVYSPKHYTKTQGAFMSYNSDIETSVLMKEEFLSNEEDWSINFNLNMTQNPKEMTKYLELIKQIKNVKSVIKEDSQILIDNDGLFIFINDDLEPKELENIINLL
ncbi:hypothetical protein OF363_00095 [Mycoplasma enhydrae]|uniref:hypothetical protein n=1 Tax=Mycoplasma enhydrae TaxID=2499220 RepID=UPI0021E8F875|nr:hypothetical protein [Mycoplasma enhydrae]MCV3733448.1 hypothetical protein [Mycoplasma enhydrae]